MRLINKWVVLVVPVALVLAACEKEVPEPEERLRPVRYVTIAGSADGRTRAFSGTSRSTQISRLSFKVSGTVVELPVEVGDRLAPGNLIARLDSSGFELEVQQAQAALVQAQANERNARSNYERVKGLYENNNASRNELDSGRAAAESASAQVRSAQKALELAQLSRSYTKLTADRDCTVASVEIDLNENVASGTEVARVNCGTGLEIELAIPDGLISEIRREMNVEIRFDSIPDLMFAGTVTEIGVSSSSGAPTFPVIVSVDGTERRLRSGLSADVTFRFSGSRQGSVYLLPTAAVAHDGETVFVFTVQDADDGRSRVRKQEVRIGDLTDTGIEVLGGLKEGDRVVTAGVSVLRDGQSVLLD